MHRKTEKINLLVKNEFINHLKSLKKHHSHLGLDGKKRGES